MAFDFIIVDIAVSAEAGKELAKMCKAFYLVIIKKKKKNKQKNTHYRRLKHESCRYTENPTGNAITSNLMFVDL